MPSFIKSAAIAAFAGVAAAQYSNGTAPAAVAVAGWTYQGCAIATAATGALIDSSPMMTVERCLAAAGAYNYARIQGANCYGASSTNGTSSVADLSCNTRCPGNQAEACGGSAGAMKRQAAGTTVSVYARQVQPAAGVVYNTLITNIYVDYCSSCAGGLTSIAYCSLATVTACGCASQTTPTIAMTTTTVTKTLSGSATTLTLTVPAGVTPGTATAATVTAAVTTVVACSTCPVASTVTVGSSAVTTVPAGSAIATVTYCPGCASGTGSVASTATAVVVTPVAVPTTTASVVVASSTRVPATQFTGAADMKKPAGALLAGAMAFALL